MLCVKFGRTRMRFILGRRKIYILKMRVLRAEIWPPLSQVCGTSFDLLRAVVKFLGFISANFIDLLAPAISQDNLVVRDFATFVITLDISESR